MIDKGTGNDLTLKESVSEYVDIDSQIFELERKKAELNEDAEKYRAQRDRLNTDSKRLKMRQDKLEQQLRGLLARAHEHKQERDQLNLEVKNAKAGRDRLNKRYNELMKVVNKFKRKYLPRDGETLGKLKTKLRELEFKQMTSVLTADEEREIIELLSKIQSRIREKEKILDEHTEVKQAMDELRNVKANAERIHKLVGEFADKAQREHDKMVELYESIDKIKMEIEKVQDRFIRIKLQADEEHRKHIEYIRQVHDYEKMIACLIAKRKKFRKECEEEHAKKQTEEIMKRLQRGEKLSTEDLMIIQKMENHG